MYHFCKEAITGIHYFQIQAQEMVKVRDFLNERFKSKRTIPGTRSFHQYVPLGQLSIGCKRVSDDDDFMLQYDFTPNHTQNIPDLRISQFLSCIYDERQWIGMICDIDQEMVMCKLNSCILLIRAGHTNGQVLMTFAGYQ